MKTIIQPNNSRSENASISVSSKNFTNARSPILTVSIVAFLILMFGGFLMSFFIDQDYARDEKNWQEKLSLIAETKAEQLGQWVSAERFDLQSIAENPSLQIYVTEWIRTNLPIPAALTTNNIAPNGEINAQTKPNVDEVEAIDLSAPATPLDSAESIFIRNLLVHSAERLGYSATTESTNTPQSEQPNTGLILRATLGTPILSIPSSNLNEKVLENLMSEPNTSANMSDIYYTANGSILIGYSHPIRAIQAEAGDAPIAQLIGIKEITKELGAHLMVSEGVDPAIEVALVKSDSGNLQYMTSDGAASDKILMEDITNDPKLHLEAGSATQIGKWLRGENIDKTRVLMTSYAVANTPWVVLVSVPEQHALAASEQRRQTMWALMIAFSVIMALLIVAIWFVATSQRALSHSRHYRNLAKYSSMQGALLKMIANAQPESMFLVDSDFRFRYANFHAAKAANMTVDTLTGKSLTDVLGQAKAQSLMTLITEAMHTSRVQTLMLSIQKDGKDQTLLRTLVPVSSLGMAAESSREDPHVLVIDRDITEVTEARERRMKLNYELIELLVALMDQRDQHANNHSRHVAELAQAIAQAMGLKDHVQQYVYNAGLLMNVGKMIVPEKWLNSSEPLDDKNIKSIRQSLRASSQLLSRLDFDSAVITALKQAHEHVDGSGLEGLKGSDISIEARIITVANACISMLSRRAYRNPMSWDDAAKILTKDADSKYDRGVVAALISYMENMGGKDKVKINGKKVA